MDSTDSTTINLVFATDHQDVIGDLWLAASPVGLVSLSFESARNQLIENLTQLLNKRYTQITFQQNFDTLSPYCQAVKAYFQEKRPFALNLSLDLSPLTDFQIQILNIVRQIPYGTTTSYGEIAAQIDKPNASRAIGQVLRRNPIPIIIPCHRVLNADGTLGGYGGVLGSKRKIALLKHEGIILA